MIDWWVVALGDKYSYIEIYIILCSFSNRRDTAVSRFVIMSWNVFRTLMPFFSGVGTLLCLSLLLSLGKLTSGVETSGLTNMDVYLLLCFFHVTTTMIVATCQSIYPAFFHKRKDSGETNGSNMPSKFDVALAILVPAYFLMTFFMFIIFSIWLSLYKWYTIRIISNLYC